MSYRALNNAPYHRYLNKVRYGLRSTEGKMFIYSGFGNVIALQIILRNEVLGSNNVFKVASTLNKVWLIFGLKGIPIEKSSISKTNVACYNTKLFSLYYEPLCGSFRRAAPYRRAVHDLTKLY